MLRRSLLERVLRMRLVYRQPAMARALSFEYLNRQLVWHELSELLLFLLPLVNVGAVKRFVRKRLAAPEAAEPAGALSTRRLHLLRSAMYVSAGPDLLQRVQPCQAYCVSHRTRGSSLPHTGAWIACTQGTHSRMRSTSLLCAGASSAAPAAAQPCSHCGTAPVPVPYTALPCGHLYCYFCLRQQCAADKGFRCERCFLRVAAMRAALPPRVEA